MICRALRIGLLLLLFAGAASNLSAELPTPAPAGPLFQPRPFGPLPPPTATPERKAVSEEEEKPIPLSWIVGGAIAVVLALSAIYYGAARHWRSSNLFDRQYRFSMVHDPALRFGAKKCGGHLATVRMSDPSKAKDG